MNVFEKQINLQRELAELSTSTWTQLGELSNSSREAYMELNKQFGEKLPEFGDIAGWTELQQKYGEAVWANVQDFMTAQGEIVKQALEQSNELFKAAFTPEVEAPQVTKAPAKTRKKAA